MDNVSIIGFARETWDGRASCGAAEVTSQLDEPFDGARGIRDGARAGNGGPGEARAVVTEDLARTWCTGVQFNWGERRIRDCLLYTSPSPRD